jgi:RecJ-like exonuclease
MFKTCKGCEGKGRYVGFNVVVEDPCKYCEGKGKVWESTDPDRGEEDEEPWNYSLSFSDFLLKQD